MFNGNLLVVEEVVVDLFREPNLCKGCFYYIPDDEIFPSCWVERDVAGACSRHVRKDCREVIFRRYERN